MLLAVNLTVPFGTNNRCLILPCPTLAYLMPRLPKWWSGHDKDEWQAGPCNLHKRCAISVSACRSLEIAILRLLMDLLQCHEAAFHKEQTAS
jgi:hypothetical protein